MTEINREATAVFDRFGTNETRFLYDADLKDFPALSALGNSVGLFVGDAGFPTHIRIRYGTHRHTKFVLVFDPRRPLQFQSASAWVAVHSNIFVMK